MAENEKFYIRDRGRVSGPFSRENIQELARRGRFRRQHQISRDGKTWERAASIPELFPAPVVRPRAQPKQALIESPPVSDGSAPMASKPVDQDDQGIELQESTLGMNVLSDSWATNWYYTNQGQQIGPITQVELLEMIQTGQVLPTDYVWHAEMGDEWFEAKELDTVFPEISEFMSAAHHGDGAGGVPRTSALATTSLVLGICGMSILFFVGSLLAVIFGHVALNRIQKQPHIWKGRGLAIAGLTLGYLVISISIIALSVYAVLVATGQIEA